MSAIDFGRTGFIERGNCATTAGCSSDSSTAIHMLIAAPQVDMLVAALVTGAAGNGVGPHLQVATSRLQLVTDAAGGNRVGPHLQVATTCLQLVTGAAGNGVGPHLHVATSCLQVGQRDAEAA